MSKFSSKHFTVAAMLAALAVAVLTHSRQAVAQDQGGGPRVTITNPLPLPVTNVDDSRPFQFAASGAFGDGFVSFGPVLAGQRWIVEHVSVSATGVTTGFQVNEFRLFKRGEPGFPGDSLVPQQTRAGLFLANAQTKFIADAGDILELGAVNSRGDVDELVSGFISGTVVPRP